jgi:hypothetical protein
MIRIIFSALIAGMLAGPAVAKDELPETTPDGLQRIHNSEWGAVYAAPGADLSGYDQVIIVEPAVAFKKDWLRDYNRNQVSNRASQGDMDKIRERMAKEFDEVFREVIAADNGYPVVTEEGPTVLILRPAIVNLDPRAPADIGVGRSRVYADSAGSMALYLEIYDSVTGALIAKGYDAKADRSSGFMEWQTSVSNRQAADRILKEWAQDLRAALDRAHAQRP